MQLGTCSGRISAATQGLQNYLHIGTADASCRNNHLAFILIQHKGCADSGNVQQLVGCLGRQDPGCAVVQSRNGNLLAVKPGGFDDLVLRHGILEIIAQQQLHLGGIRAHTAQRSSRLKGALTGPDIEELGIQTDTRQQRLGLNGKDILLFHRIGQKLRYQFRCRRCGCLMEVHHNSLNVVCCPVMMVYHADLGNSFQQRHALHAVRTIGIHNNQDTVIVRCQQRILPGNKDVLILRHLTDLIDKTGTGIFLQVNDNVRLFALLPAQAGNTHSSTH